MNRYQSDTKFLVVVILGSHQRINIKESTKETKIKKIVHLSKYFQHQKTFYDMTKDDKLDYPNSLRKNLSLGSNGYYLCIQY